MPLGFAERGVASRPPTDAQPERARVIAKTAGMRVGEARHGKPRSFGVKSSGHSGAVELTTPAVRGRVSHEWPYSTDQKVWQSAPSSIRARTIIPGLQPGALTYF